VNSTQPYLLFITIVQYFIKLFTNFVVDMQFKVIEALTIIMKIYAIYAVDKVSFNMSIK